MNPNCHRIRQQVLELPLAEVQLDDHVQHCDACRRLIHTLAEELTKLDEALDTYVDAETFDSALARTRRHPRRWRASMAAVGIGTALAAAVAWSLLPERLVADVASQPRAELAHLEPGHKPSSAAPATPVPIPPDSIESFDPQGPLEVLEATAMLGKLTRSQCVGLLALRDDGAVPLARRDHASRLLMIHAFASGRVTEWAQLTKHHLTELDPNDPDLHYKFALHLSKQGPARAPELLEHAELALEQRHVWSGNTYDARVFSLHKLRARAAERLWTIDPTEEARAQTASFARQWAAFAASVGKSTEAADALCRRVEDEDYCRATP